MTTNDFTDVRGILRALSLSESDFTSDAVGKQIAEFKSAVDSLDADAEPWVIEWLGQEHYKGAVLFTAAKVNWSKNQTDPGKPFDPRSRAAIVSRFNGWAVEVLDRLDVYERSTRRAADVAQWIDGLARFRADPVHQP